MSPRPRPTPDDSLFADDNLTPYLMGSSSPSRRSSLTLSGLDHDLSSDQRGCDSWSDEELGGLSIELTRSSSGGSSSSSNGSTKDPLVLDSLACHNDAELAALMAARPEEDEACQNDAEIAALMAAQWRKQDRKRRMEIQHEGKKASMATPEEQEKADQACTQIWLMVMVILLVAGLGIRHVMKA